MCDFRAHLLIAFVVAWLLTPPTLCVAQPPAWEAGDYGPVVSTALDVTTVPLKDTTKLSDTQNYVFRGRVIRLSEKRDATICYDVEHMRMAGAWTGGYLKWRGPERNMGPTPAGTFVAATLPGPGWSHQEQWADPRQPAEGPLPREWAKYRGLYVHGERVVLDYTVGSCRVLESPAAVTHDNIMAIVRNYTLGPSEVPLGLLVCEEPEARGTLVGKNGESTVKGAPAHVTRVVWGGKTSKLAVGVVGTPAGARWEVAGNRLHLLLPKLDEGVSFRIVMARLSEGAPLKLETLKPWLSPPEDKPLPIENLRSLTAGGPGRWTESVTTAGTRSQDEGPYVVDDIALPMRNPWKVNVRCGGLDFFRDGRAAVCTWDGDVWVVSGLDEGLSKLTWRRYASGLHQPLGLKIVEDVVYVAGRDQITRLHDLNQDGEADHYENLNNDAGLTLQRHEFVLDLQTDKSGNFYYCRSGHYIPSAKGENCCVYQLSADGSKLEVLARGLREPNGMSIGPEGVMTVADNEGNGVPQTPVYLLKKGAFYGYTPQSWKPGELPLVWLPKQYDQSAGGQVWVTSDRWGPLSGHLLHTSYGNCTLMDILVDRGSNSSKEVWQAAAYKFPLTFGSGVMRGRFSERDGQLYLCGLRGWGTAAARESQFCRVRYTGKPVRQPVGWKVTPTGFDITFAVPLNRQQAEDDQNYAGEWYPKGFQKPSSKTQPMVAEMSIARAKLSADGKTVSLEIDDLEPVTNWKLQYQLKAADGADVKGELIGTIHRVPGGK